MTHEAAEIAVPEGSALDHRADLAPTRMVRPELQVLLIASILLVATLVFVLVTPDSVKLDAPFGSFTFFIIMLMFGAFEFSVFQVRFGREGLSFALNEVPMAFAIVFLSPFGALLARIPLTIVVLVFARDNRGYKLAFNIAIFMFELSLAGLIFNVLARSWGSEMGSVVVAVTVALIAVAPLTSILISLAISRFEGGAIDRIVTELEATWWMYTVNAVLAAMTVSLTLLHPALSLLAILPIMGMWHVLHSYGALGQELRDLDAVHGFAGRVGETLDVQAIGDVAVDEVLRLFRATGAVLIRFTEIGPVLHAAGDLQASTKRPIEEDYWKPICAIDEVRVIQADRLLELGIVTDRRPVTVLMTPVNDGGSTPAVLAVARQDLAPEQFDAGDKARLGNIGRQLSVSLRRGILHERLEWEARHDALTGLPSRTLFERLVTEATASTRSGIWGVMMLDLDRFKEVNDTLGHHAGDALLIEFSRRMSSVLGPEDGLARLAGDEFAVLCHRETHAEVVELAQRCVREGGRPVTLDGLEIVVTVSVGVAEIVEGDAEAIQPMRRADIAMYNAKWQRTGVEFYRDEIDRRTPARLSMLGDLRTAIETDQLTVVYQPKLNLTTGKIVGVEALVRWDHPTRGNVPPTEFVRVAEDTGLIKQLTDLVLSTGIGTLAEFRRLGIDIDMSVNLSTHDLFDSRLPDRVRDYLQSHDVDPSCLTLEITESSLFVDAPRTRATIDGLYHVGLRMAVDDFGTGYSSLSYLRRLPVHELKIDQSFVARMLIDPQDDVIVRSTVDLGHNLGLLVVAEGVETFDVLDRLREIGCDVAQGYAISEPVLADDIVAWLQTATAEGWEVGRS